MNLISLSLPLSISVSFGMDGNYGDELTESVQMLADELGECLCDLSGTVIAVSVVCDAKTSHTALTRKLLGFCVQTGLTYQDKLHEFLCFHKCT